MTASPNPTEREIRAGWKLGFGQIRHMRLRPVVNRFVYKCIFVEGEVTHLNGRRAGNWWFGLNRPGLLSFHESDHGDGRPANAWLAEILDSSGLPKPVAIEYRGFARLLGYVFKPVSFWFCLNEHKRRYAVVAEVNNTFGERHCYVLSDHGHALQNGRLLRADKVFHVSPFCRVEGSYQFRFLDSGARSIARIDLNNDEGPLLQTSISGTVSPITGRQVLRALVLYPLFTLGVIARIHWQAIKLWLHRVPFYSKPEPPEQFASNGTSSRISSISNQRISHQ